MSRAESLFMTLCMAVRLSCVRNEILRPLIVLAMVIPCVMWGTVLKAEDSSRLRALTPEQAAALIQEESLEREVQRPTRYTFSPSERARKEDDRECITVQIEGDQINLNGLQEISDKTALVLGRHRGDLYLDGLTAISPKTAKALASHCGLLALNGLKCLSEEEAELLSSHDGPLLLDGIQALDPTVAAKLCKSSSDLRLNGIQTITAEAAECLGKRYGTTHLLGLKRFSRLAYHKMAQCSVRLPKEFILDSAHDVVFLAGVGLGGQPDSPTLANWIKVISDESGADMRIDRDAFRTEGIDPDAVLSFQCVGQSPWSLEALADSLAAAVSGDRIAAIVAVRDGDKLVFTSRKAAKATTP